MSNVLSKSVQYINTIVRRRIPDTFCLSCTFSTFISNYVSTYILLYFCPGMARRRLHYTAGKPLWSIKFIAAIKIYTEPGSRAAKLNFPTNADSRFMEPLYFAA